jgi:chromate transport protein ChrA
VAIGVALLALLLLFARTRSSRTTWLPLIAGALAYLVIVLVGAIGYLMARGALADGLLYLASSASSLFTIADAVLAAVAGLVFVLLLRARAAGAHRPRWPWERPDEP